MTSWLWMWWQGYVTIRLRGPGLERILNKAADAGVLLTNVERLTPDVIIIRLQAREFRLLRPLLRGTHINVSILDRHGVPFLLRKIKLRTFLIVGLVLSLAFVVYLSNFVWIIEVFGNETVATSSLKIAVEDMGLQAGVPKSAINARQIEGELLQRFPDLAFAQVIIKGVKVELLLVERDGVDVFQAEGGHVYAKRDGIVTELLVLKGTPEVNEGETVRQDDLLISGVYYDQHGRKQFGAAQGIIKARVWYQAVGEASLVRWEPVKTGRIHRQYALTIGPLRIPVGRSYSEETHLKNTRDWHLSLGSAMVPLSFSKTVYEQVDYVSVAVPDAEAEREAYLMAWESLLSQGILEENVLEEKTKVDLMPDADGIRITVQVEVLEDIGQFFGH